MSARYFFLQIVSGYKEISDGGLAYTLFYFCHFVNGSQLCFLSLVVSLCLFPFHVCVCRIFFTNFLSIHVISINISHHLICFVFNVLISSLLLALWRSNGFYCRFHNGSLPVAGLLSMVVFSSAPAETNGHLLVGVSGIAVDVSLGLPGMRKGSFLADAAV